MRSESCAVWGGTTFFDKGGSIFPDACRPCPDRSSGCCVPAFPKGGASRRRTKGYIAGRCSGDSGGCVRGGSVRLRTGRADAASRCRGPRSAAIRPRLAGSPGTVRSEPVGGGGRCAEEGPSRGAALSPAGLHGAGSLALVGRQRFVAGCSRGRPDRSGFVCRPSRSGTVCVGGKGRNLRGGKFRVAKGSFAERAFCGSTLTPARTFLFAVGFGLSVSRKSADFRSVSFRQGCGRNAARSMPAPKSAKSYRTGSSGSNVRSASVTSSTAFQSFCRRTSRPSSREVLPVWTSSGR